VRAWGPRARARQGRRGRRVDPVALRQDHHRGDAPGRERGGGGAGRRPRPLPVRQALHRAHGDGQPPRPPRQEDGARPRVRLRRAVEVPLGGGPALFEYDEESKAWAPAHHAFTRPRDQDLPYLETDPGRVYCWRYDLVLNGFEIGGGSIRLHDPRCRPASSRPWASRPRRRAQVRLPARRAEDGAPPHGGIALGMDGW